MSYIILGSFAAAAGLLAIALLFLAVKAGDRIRAGLLPWYIPVFLFGQAMAVLFSGRQLTETDLMTSGSTVAFGWMSWVIRAASIVLAVSFALAVYRYIFERRRIHPPQMVIATAFTVFWICNVIAPIFFSRFPGEMGAEHIYPLILVYALCLLNQDELLTLIRLARNAVALYILLSLLVAAAMPDVALQTSYTQSYFGAMPRLFGVAPHAIALAVVCVTGLVLAWRMPFQNKAIQWVFVGACFVALVLSQAKAVWLSVIAALFLVLPWAVVPGRRLFDRLALSSSRGFVGVGGGLILVAILLFTCSALFFGDRWVAEALDMDQLQKLSTLTGRDMIWEVAQEEWRRNPVFGYGFELFGATHRMQIGMPHATSGHSLWFDTLGRAGTVGLLGLVVYLLIVMRAAFTGSETRVYSLFMFVSLLVQSVSEVSIAASSVSPTNIAQFIMLALILSGNCRQAVTSRRVVPPGELPTPTA